MKPAHLGLVAFLGCSMSFMAAVALLWGGSDAKSQHLPSGARPPTPAAQSGLSVAAATPAAAAPSAQALPDFRAASLLARWLERTSLTNLEPGDDELARLERELLALGEAAAGPLIEQLGRERDSARRDPLLNLLRKVPGATSERFLIEEARAGSRGSSRTLAIDALAERRSEQALGALNEIASSDPDLPRRPFLTEPRQPGDDSTELPDEVTFTPRMKAMAALASTQDARVTPMLAEIMRSAPDESLRMEAARNLAQLRTDPLAVDALLASLSNERSAYVRLAALHSLDGVVDARLQPLLSQLAQHDPDRGVQVLAARLLSPLLSAR